MLFIFADIQRMTHESTQINRYSSTHRVCAPLGVMSVQKNTVQKKAFSQFVLNFGYKSLNIYFWK